MPALVCILERKEALAGYVPPGQGSYLAKKMLYLDVGKLFENLKAAQEHVPPYKGIENHEKYRQIIMMVERDEIDFNAFTEDDLKGLLEICSKEEENDLLYGLEETALLMGKFKNLKPKRVGRLAFI